MASIACLFMHKKDTGKIILPPVKIRTFCNQEVPKEKKNTIYNQNEYSWNTTQSKYSHSYPQDAM